MVKILVEHQFIGIGAEQWPSTLGEIKPPERGLERKVQWDGYNHSENRDLCKILSRSFDISQARAKVSPMRLREDDEESVWKAEKSTEGKKITNRKPLAESILNRWSRKYFFWREVAVTTEIHTVVSLLLLFTFLLLLLALFSFLNGST